MRNGIPGHASACFCEECQQHSYAVAMENWEKHQSECAVESSDRHLVPYHMDPEKPEKYPARMHCSACKQVIFEKVIG